MESTPPVSERRPVGSTLFDFTLLFRGVGVALWPPKRLLLALVGVIATGLLGLALDAVWPASASPQVVQVGGGWLSESVLYGNVADAEHVHAAIDEAVAAGNTCHTTGVFEQLLFRVRTVEDRCIAGVFGLDFRELIAAGRDVLMTASWLVSMHSVYAILFGLGCIGIWGFVGVGISRGVALSIARGDEPTIVEYFDACKGMWMQAATAPLIPVLIILMAAIGLWVFGLIGAIPFVGGLFVGLLFPLVILGGAVMAMALVLGTAAIPMTSCGIAASGEDAMDSLGKAVSFVFSRPVKTLLYYLVAFVIGVITFAAIKWLISLSLWCGGNVIGMTMDVGPASVTTMPANSVDPGRLEAMWTPPSPAGGTPFYGTFPGFDVAGASEAARGLIWFWLVLTWSTLAAFAVSYFFTSAGIAWFLLRRQVDHTDITEVNDEIADKEAETGSAVS